MYSEVTNTFKEAVKSNVITTTARLTFKNFFPNAVENQDLVLIGENVSDKGLSIEDDMYNDGTLIGTAMSKEVEVEIFNPSAYDLADKEFDLEVGVMTDRETETYEYVPYGTFIVSDYEDLKSSSKYKIIANDTMIKLNEEFEKNTTFSPTFPIILIDFYSEFMASYGIEVERQTLPNQDFLITAMPNFDGYTGRQILMRIAELFGSAAKINRNNKCQMYLKTETNEKITADEMNSSLEIDNRYGPVNVVTIGMSNVEGENVTMQDTESIETYGETTIRIDDNPFTYTEELREAAIVDLYNHLRGFSYIPVSFKLKGLFYTDCGDAIQVENIQTGEYVETIILNQYFNVPKTRQSTIESPALTETSQKYKYISQSKAAQTRTEIIVDKQNQTITETVELVTENNTRITETLQTVDRILQSIQDYEDITDEITGATSITLENCMEGHLYEFHIYGNNTVFGDILVSETRYVGDDSILGSTSFLQVTDPEGLVTVYDLEISEELRQSGQYYDEFVIKDGYAYELRRITFDEQDNIIIVENPEPTNKREFSIDLAEGDNIITIYQYDANMYARWVVKNEFTDIFATKVLMESRIDQSAQEIELEVVQIVQDETEPLETQISALEITASQISSQVSTINGEITTMSSTISQQSDLIEAKLDSDDFTSAAVIGLINNRDGTSTAKIAASNINLTGYVTATALSGSGTTTINGANITTGTISSSRLDTSTINASNGTIAGWTITSDSLDSSTAGMSNGHQYAFYVKVGTTTPYYVKMDGGVVCTSILVGGQPLIKSVADSGQFITQMRHAATYMEYVVDGYGTFGVNCWQSDTKLKKNIKDTEMNGLDFIKQIHHVQFDWKRDDSHVKIGYLANELKELDENVVFEVKQQEGCEYDSLLQIDETKVIPYMTKAMQEMSQEIDGLKNENQELKAENQELKSIINDLISRIEKLEKGA